MTNYITPFLERATPYFNQATSKTSSLISKVGIEQLGQMALLYQLFDSAVANMLCLHTLRHGTSLDAFLMINWEGTKNDVAPFRRATEEGLTPNISGGQVEKTKRINVYHDPHDDSFSLGEKIATKLILPFLTANKSWGAHERVIEFIVPNSNYLLLKAVRKVVVYIGSFMLGMLSPTVKFRFTPAERADFLVDKDGDASLYREQDIPPSHLGVSGSIRQGSNRSLVGRITSHPGKFILGVAQLAAVVALTSIWVGGASVPVLSTLLAQHRIKTLAALWISTW